MAMNLAICFTCFQPIIRLTSFQPNPDHRAFSSRHCVLLAHVNYMLLSQAPKVILYSLEPFCSVERIFEAGNQKPFVHTWKILSDSYTRECELPAL